MKSYKNLKKWWLRSTFPGRVGQKLAWRGHVLNSLILGFIFLTVFLFIVNLSGWLFRLNKGQATGAAFLICLTYLTLFWISKRKSILVALVLFNVLGVAISFLLSLGWGIVDIVTNVVYAAVILQASILLRGKTYALIIGALLIGYPAIGWAELNGWFTPPFHTGLNAYYLTIAVFLLFLNYLGYTTARLIDQALGAQTAETTRRQLLESRTRIATQVQLSMLPAVSPHHLDFDIAGQSIPARAVGGDFYSYHKLAKDRLAVIIGDVSGKGMPAALLMAVTTGIIDSLASTFTNAEPAELLEAIAIRLRKHTFRSRLNTACLVAFLERDRLRVVNAGCVEPIIRRVNGQVEWLNIGGLPLGTEMTSTDLKRGQVETFLDTGDMAIFITDGVVEAKNASHEMLGFERIQTIIADGPTHSVEAMKHHILDKVEAHRGLAEQNDDVTVIVVQERGT